MITLQDSPTIDSLISMSNLEFILKLRRDKLISLANTAGRFYHPYDLHKQGTNKWRHIDNPQYPLKRMQKRILKNILEKNQHLLPQGMVGGISGKSIVENAKIHVNKDCIGIVDIKDCFPNTHDLRIYQVWRKYFGCNEQIASLLTKLTTFQHRLPQGAPTSPLLCNYSLISTFSEVERYAKLKNLHVSIFVDDITISGSRANVTEAITYIIEILVKNRYSVRNRKVKIISSGFKQKVTGITVNKKLSTNRERIQEIRNLILETAKLKEYIPSCEYNKIRGSINFAKQVSNSQGEKLEKLAEEVLVRPITNSKKAKNDTTRVCKRYSKNHIYKE